ncbi:MAG: DsbA family protein [Burkholderiaceae bacterium]
MKTLDWYFDFISPYSYLQNAVLGRIATRVDIRRRPVLFGGILGHWGQLGPAEIVPKRAWTFLHCTWLAARHGVPLTMPTMHPFNPLPLLRLSHALGNTADVVDRLFAFVWIDGHVPTDRDAWTDLLAELAVDERATQTPEVKEALRVAGTDAVAANVFGVPAAVVDGHVFWGLDATDMLIDYLNDAPLFTGAAMQAARDLPVGPMRPRRARAAA